MAHRDAPVRVGDLIVVEPQTLVAGGDALARIDGFPLFIASIYPGDCAQVRVTEVRRGWGRGELVDLIEASPARRIEPCPAARDCGGCDWTELRLDAQLRAKRTILLEALTRIGRLPLETLPPITIHPSPLNYRLRSRLHPDGKGSFGFFAPRSHRVVPLPPECEVVGPILLANIDRIVEAVGTKHTGSIEIFETSTEITIAPADDQGPEIEITVGPDRFHFATGSFFQVNRHLLETLVRLVTESAEKSPRRNLAVDLYAGVGFFTLPLARLFASVISVEGSENAHRWSVRNIASHPNVELIHRDVEGFVRRIPNGVDFIMTDPPRAGMGDEVVKAIHNSDASRICFLSCDPVTFARDASALVRRGWSLLSIDLVDLFPNTHHVETLSSFTRV